MDANFFEFWGQALLGIAKGQRQMEEFNRWLRQGLSASDPLSALLRRIYGLEKSEEQDAEYLDPYEKIVASFLKSFRDYLLLFDVAPRGDLDGLRQECEALKQQIMEQDQTIAQLREALDEKELHSDRAARDMQRLLQKQTDQFQQVMKAMGQAFQQRRPSRTR